MAINRENLTTEQNKLLNDIEKYEEIVKDADKMIDQYSDDWFGFIDELPRNSVSFDQILTETFEEYEKQTGVEDAYEKYSRHLAIDEAVTLELIEYERKLNQHGFILRMDKQSFAIAMDIDWSPGDILGVVEHFGDDFPVLTLCDSRKFNTLVKTARDIVGYFEEDLDYYLDEDMDKLWDYYFGLESIVNSYQDDIARLDRRIKIEYEIGIIWINELKKRLPLRIAEQLKKKKCNGDMVETTRLQLSVAALYNSMKSGKLMDDFGENNLPNHCHVYLAPIDGKDIPVLTYNGEILFKDKDIIYPVLPDYLGYFKDNRLYQFPESIKELILATATHT